MQCTEVIDILNNKHISSNMSTADRKYNIIIMKPFICHIYIPFTFTFTAFGISYPESLIDVFLKSLSV